MRRRDGTGNSCHITQNVLLIDFCVLEQPPITTQRKLSSSGPAPVLTPKDGGQPSPRPRIGFASSFDGVLSGGDSWTSRRRTSDAYLRGAAVREELCVGDTQTDSRGSETISEGEKGKQADPDGVGGLGTSLAHSNSQSSLSHDTLKDDAHPQVVIPLIDGCLSTHETRSNSSNGTDIGTGRVYSTGIQDLASVEWSYLDPQGQVQGKS
jgi:PERQ amino acid-rich with GYF domain-containing protein